MILPIEAVFMSRSFPLIPLRRGKFVVIFSRKLSGGDVVEMMDLLYYTKNSEGVALPIKDITSRWYNHLRTIHEGFTRLY
jgi:hypothetical protein